MSDGVGGGFDGGQWVKQAALQLQPPKRGPANNVVDHRFAAKRPNLQTSNPQPIKMDNIKSSLLDSLEHYVVAQSAYKKKRDKQFKFFESQLIIANKETKQLIEEKRQLVTDLHNAAQELEHYKQISEQLREEKDKVAQELQNCKQDIDRFKQNTEQTTRDFNTLKGEMKYLSEEKGRILKQKDHIADSLQKSEQMLEYYKHTANELKEIQTKFEKFKGMLKFAIGEKNRVSKEKDKIADELKKAREHTGGNPKDFDSDDDSFHCLICMEPWTESQSGDHNICSLACGHFFGRSCITKWIKQNCDGNSSKCPTCQKNATLKDIRNHYVHHLSVGNGRS